MISFQVLFLIFNGAYGIVLVPEKKETLLKCIKTNWNSSLIVNLNNGDIEIAAFYANSYCVAFGNMTCSYNSMYNILSTRDINWFQRIASYFCEHYIFHEEKQFKLQEKKLHCPPHGDLTTVALMYKDGTITNVGFLKTMHIKCSLGMKCAVVNNDYLMEVLNYTHLIVSYICSSYMIKSNDTNVLPIPDARKMPMVFTLICPKVNQSLSINVLMKDGQSSQYSTYHNDICNTSLDTMTCSSTDSNFLLTVPVSLESRNMTSLSCSENTTEDIAFYSDAIDIKCRSPIITSEKFSVMCNITNVYPSIECTLFKITDGKKSVVTHKVQYEESFHPTATLYFETSCELTIPATQLGQGVQQYVVVASASNFPQGHHEYHIERSLLEPPEAVFDPTCISGQGVLKGYILANTTLNCTCWRNVTSHIYSQVLWVKDGILEPSAIRLRNSSTLTLHMTKDIENNFSCLAVSPLGNSSITFNVPKIAFGPTNVMTSVQNLSLNVCSNHSITCWVLQKEVSPDVEFNMKVDHPESFLVRMTTKSLVSTIIITPVRVGNFTLTCNVKNSIFDIEAQANISVNVSESSKNLPAFVVNNGLPISESQKAVKVTCFMQDNSNVVTSLTLQCLNDSKSVNGPVVSMLKSFSRKHNGSKCECQARFKEDCFISRTSSFIIIVAYGPTEMEVSRRNMFMELCTFETLRCSVSSNNVFPGVYFHCNASPADSLVVEQSNNVSTVNSAQFQIASFRKGKFTVTCSAINVLNQKLRVRKDIFITVEELSSQLPVIRLLNKKLPLVEGVSSKNVTISCDVPGGFHRIQNLSLTCLDQTTTKLDEPITINRNITRGHNLQCKCVAYYTSQCYGQREAVLDIQLVYGPSEVFPYLRTVHTRKCTETTVGCFVLKTDVSPKAKFVFSAQYNDTAIQFKEDIKTSIYPFYAIKVTALDVGEYTLRCTAENVAENSLKVETNISLVVTESILHKPLFIINSEQTEPHDNLEEMSFSITCVKSENAFDLMTMTLTCNNKTVTKQANAITVYHDFRDQITCTCIAHYQDSCNISYETSSGYNLKCTSPVVYVNDGNPMIVHNSETNITITCRGLESENYYSNITLTCLGMTISDLGTSTTLYALITKRDHGSSCTCTIKSLYCDENRTSEFILDFSYDTGVIHYMVNNNSQVEISEGEMLEFVCLVESYPKPDIVIKSDGNSLLNETWKPNVTSLKTEDNIWAIHFLIANSSCLNTNNYTCMESNPVTLTQSQTSVLILVKCSLHVYESDSSPKHFEYHIDDEAAISVKLYGHPQPTNIQLLKGIDSREINQTKYSANFTELKKPLILVNLIIHKIQEEDFTNYLLRADNGVGKPLLWEFIVVKGDSILDIDIVLTVSLIIGFLVLISALVRYKMKRNQKDRNRQVRPRRNDGDQKTFFNPRYSTSTVSENFLPKVSEIDEDRNSIGMCSLNTDLSSVSEIDEYGVSTGLTAINNDDTIYSVPYTYRYELPIDDDGDDSEVFGVHSTFATLKTTDKNKTKEHNQNVSTCKAALNHLPDRLLPWNYKQVNMKVINCSDVSVEGGIEPMPVMPAIQESCTTQPAYIFKMSQPPSESLPWNYKRVNMKVINCSVVSVELENEKLQNLFTIQESDVDSNKCDPDRETMLVESKKDS